ncbi:PrsW family intramembrane metalloprotease [Candidatus Nomurabacteria bacterium]|nr:PrsW family intramembrane metalloprotease [Candidatus Nomurabacteria bacterium]
MAIFGESHTLIYAILGGVIPALVWLWFWLREDTHPEPIGLIIAAFIIGALSVMFVVPLQKYASTLFTSHREIIVAWASIEEIIKFIIVAVVALGTRYMKEPIDFPIYFITVALGFAAFENILFIIKPLNAGNMLVGFLTGNLRFLGSTLLHAMASAIIGIGIGLAWDGTFIKKSFFAILGLIGAISLHSVFNFFIMDNAQENFLTVFGFLWVFTIINMLLFEKLRRMGQSSTVSSPVTN